MNDITKRRTNAVTSNFTDEEMDDLQNAAAVHGMPASRFVRIAATRAAKHWARHGHDVNVYREVRDPKPAADTYLG